MLAPLLLSPSLSGPFNTFEYPALSIDHPIEYSAKALSLPPMLNSNTLTVASTGKITAYNTRVHTTFFSFSLAALWLAGFIIMLISPTGMENGKSSAASIWARRIYQPAATLMK